MAYYSRNVSLAIDLETTLRAGTGGKVQIGAPTAGVLPLAVPTISAPGNGYPASTTMNVRYVDAAGVATATGTVTTTAGGVLTSATVTNGGAGYSGGAAAYDIEGDTPEYGQWTGMGTGYIADARGVLIGSDFDLKFNAIKIERDVLRGFMGGKEVVPGTQWVEMTFTTEMAPSGVRGIRPGWAKLIKAAGFAEVYTTSGGVISKIDYVPVSDGFQSLSMRALFGGVRISVKGARVSKMEIDLSVNTLPTCKWTVIGIMNGGATNAFANVSTASWALPAVITDANTADIKFGSAYNTSTGALTGGTAYPSQGLKLMVENNAKYRPFLGGDSVPITQRETTGTIVADLTDAQRLDWWQKFSLNTLESVSFGLGVSAGSILRVFSPNTERQEPTNVDDDGLFLTSTPLRCRPSWANGNDEIRFVLL